MVRRRAIKTQLAEPPISEIEVGLFAKTPLRANAEAVADDQHADHQLGINRGAPRAAVERRQLSPDVAKLDDPVDRPQKAIWRDVPFERELIEQRSLLDLPMSHHDLQSCLMQRLNQRTTCVATEDFFNRIDQKATTLIRLLGGSPMTAKANCSGNVNPASSVQAVEVGGHSCWDFLL
jgi:hypothetical protein